MMCVVTLSTGNVFHCNIFMFTGVCLSLQLEASECVIKS